MFKIISSLTLFLISISMSLNADTSIYDIPLTDINGNATSLAEHKGKVLLIVNVASKCGYTKQYEGLEKLYDDYKDKDVVVLGFPCNQFGGQEPGTEAEIAEFCRLTFGVSFPMYSKLDVNGENRHPLYQLLAGKQSPFPGDIGCNFNKFLISKSGSILHRYESKVEPNSDQLVGDIKAALKS